MSESTELSDRTLPPSELRLADARRDGRVARSDDLTGTVVLAGGALLIGLVGPTLLGEVRSMMVSLLASAGRLADPQNVSMSAWAACRGTVLWAGVLLGGLTLLAALGGFVQVGPLVTTRPLRPRWDRLNPAEGLRRVVNGRSLFRGGMAIMKYLLVAGVLAAVLVLHSRSLLNVSAGTGRDMLAGLTTLLSRTMFALAGVLGLLAAADLLYQRYRHRRELMMTRREQLDETRRNEGDPAVRARRRKLAGRTGQRISMTVPLATVVLCGLRNATVAIRLEGRRSGRVVAMGMGATGSDIRTTADRAGVPCIDAPALAGELMVKTRPNALLPATMIDRIHDTREGADANG